MASTATKKTASKAAPKKTSTGKQSQVSESSLLLELFTDGIKDIYWAEKHLLKGIPKMQKAATSEELKNAFAEHLEVTRNQITRLEQVFEILGKKAQAKKCDAMDGLSKEGDSIIESTPKGTSTRDVGLILAAQKIEHYEIATYGGLSQLATTLGMDEISGLLAETLEEEKEADSLLSDIAENNINIEAAEEE